MWIINGVPVIGSLNKEEDKESESSNRV